MSQMPPGSRESPQAGSPRYRWLLFAPVIVGILLLMIAVVLVIALGLRQVFSKREANPGMPLEVTKVTPTATALATPGPTPAPSCETVISSDAVQVAVPLPISLTLASVPFPVAAVMPAPTGWAYPPDRSGSAAWVCGTVVNYVLGLEPTSDNRTLLAELRPGDEIKLHLSNGVTLFFRFVERREGVAANGASVFAQFRPRLTLIMENDDGAWQISTADYATETDPVQPPIGTMVQLGQPVQVDEAQVTVTNGYTQRSAPDLLPGTMYFLVEFTVENVGSAPLDAGIFNMQLQDGLGNSFLFSPAASAFGEHGLLTGQIEPGVTVQGTAGYLVPTMIEGPTLVWTFSPQPGSEFRASVSIPYETAAAPDAPGQADVYVTDAFLSNNGGVLNIEGEVQNVGSGPLVIEVSDISLSSSAGMGNLRAAAPPLPWTIKPGQSQIIELQYDKPNASAVLLTLLGFSFEIGGLQ